MQNASADAQARARNRYLPILSWVLVVLVAASAIRAFLPTEHKRRVAAFSRALRLIPKRFAGSADEAALYEAAMRGMVYSLDDAHSAYLNPYEVQEADAQTEGEFGGVGVTVTPRDGGAIVTEVRADGPAAAAGVVVGDVIAGADGREAAEMSFLELLSRIRGRVGTTVELSIQRAATGARETVRLTRTRILMDTVRWEKVEPGIGYVRIAQFDAHSLADTRKAIEQLQADGWMKALLVDLRGNAGGLLAEAVGVCDLFLSKGTIVRVEGRSPHERELYEAHPQAVVPEDVPLAVLIDGQSASAAEVVAGALKSHGRAALVGVRTFGKGAVNRMYGLPDGSGVVLTVAYYTAGDGIEVNGKGVEPDIKVGELPPVPASEDPQERERWLALYLAAQKEQFDRAVEFLKSKVP